MLFIIVVIAIFACLVTQKAWQIRRVSRIAVHPQVYVSSRNRLSARFQRFLAEVEPQLLEMGFHSFGGVRMFELRASLVWTGASFVNQETGERVSVLSWGHPKQYQLAIGWVTEFTDGQRVTTHWTPPAATALAAGRDSGSSAAGTPIVLDVAAWHRRRVEQAIAERESVGMLTPPGRILPAPGNESQWNRLGADRMAKQLASRLDWRVGLTGRYYEPGWPEVFQLALGGSRSERQNVSQGFEVMLTPRSVAPLKDESVADARSNKKSDA